MTQDSLVPFIDIHCGYVRAASLIRRPSLLLFNRWHLGEGLYETITSLICVGYFFYGIASK